MLAAQRYGMGEKGKIRKLLSSYTVLFALLFTVISIAGAVFTEEILAVLDTPETIFSSARSYLNILFAGIPFLAVYNTYSSVLRGIGNSRAPFFSVLVCSAVNVVLDLLFVAGMGYGAAGAAAATRDITGRDGGLYNCIYSKEISIPQVLVFGEIAG